MGVQRFLEAQPSFDIQKSATQEDEGRSVQLVRFWIRRGSRALTISHFEVGTSFSPGPSRSPE
ncbi:MAG: hypothetical protein LC641_06895 [Spirochaeta sp.]|nr:hypothetical protein [Spirochaeta sp.]